MKARLTVFLSAMVLWALLVSASWAAPGYEEPSEKEMRQAIERAMVDRGGTRTGAGEISVDNPLNGVGIRITEFTKLGCEAAMQGAGYICSYHYTTICLSRRFSSSSWRSFFTSLTSSPS